MESVLDTKGKEISRQISAKDATSPTAPEGGKVKIVPLSRLFKNAAFGSHLITVERPLRDEQGGIMLHSKGKLKGKPQADSKLRDAKNASLDEE